MSKLVKVEGEVTYTVNKSQMVQFYTEEVELPDSVKTEQMARCMLKAGLLADILRRKVEGFKRVRTIQIVGMDDVEGTPLHVKYQELLLEATELDCVPEGLERYKEGESREKALAKAIHAAKDRKKKAAAKAKKEEKGKLEEDYVD